MSTHLRSRSGTVVPDRREDMNHAERLTHTPDLVPREHDGYKAINYRYVVLPSRSRSVANTRKSDLGSYSGVRL